LPLGAILTTNKAASCIHPGMHGTTFGGGPLACAVALEVQRVTNGLLTHIERLGRYFRSHLETLKFKHKGIVEVRGMGLMIGMELESADRAKAIVVHLLEHGVLINRTHNTVLRFLPPYIIEKSHVNQVIRLLDSSLSEHAVSTSSRGRG
jgi:Ornithine/acetylornithine aminotransferase